MTRLRLQRGASFNRGPKIGAEDVNVAAGAYDAFKREEFERDTDSRDREKLSEALAKLSDFCLETVNSNRFLIEKDVRNETSSAVQERVDLKFVHQARKRVTVRDDPRTLYEAYMLDLSQYTGERKRRNLDMVEFWKKDASDSLRKRAIILRSTS